MWGRGCSNELGEDATLLAAAEGPKPEVCSSGRCWAAAGWARLLSARALPLLYMQVVSNQLCSVAQERDELAEQARLQGTRCVRRCASDILADPQHALRLGTCYAQG